MIDETLINTLQKKTGLVKLLNEFEKNKFKSLEDKIKSTDSSNFVKKNY